MENSATDLFVLPAQSKGEPNVEQTRSIRAQQLLLNLTGRAPRCSCSARHRTKRRSGAFEPFAKELMGLIGEQIDLRCVETWCHAGRKLVGTDQPNSPADPFADAAGIVGAEHTVAGRDRAARVDLPRNDEGITTVRAQRRRIYVVLFVGPRIAGNVYDHHLVFLTIRAG